jgi:hypothetical protein
MTDTEVTKDPRKVSDILLSLEEKVLQLIKTVAANDLNNRLILDRLNKLLAQGVETNTGPLKVETKPAEPAKIVVPPTPVVEVSDEPIRPRKQFTMQPIEEVAPVKNKKEKSVSKIPVGQRVTDNNGKDLFMADVVITDLDTNEVVTKAKTNAVGKWQAYLSVGNYSVHISKIVDSNTLHKIESMQEIEITPQAKSLQLPVIIIKR